MNIFQLPYVVCVLIRAAFLAWQQQETGKCAFGDNKPRLLQNRALTLRDFVCDLLRDFVCDPRLLLLKAKM